MKPESTRLWTIDELREQVSTALAVGYDGVASGRVRDIPDLRTIRYYTTLGLLDRATEMRGRTALYGRRHLLQLVSIKRLQSQGQPLSEIRSRMVGLSNAVLERTVAAGRIGTSWRDSHASVAASTKEGLPPPLYEKPQVEQQVALGSNVTVSFAFQRSIDEEDLRVIHLAAAPLMEFLRLRGLIPKKPGTER